ncbi:MAG: diguanylate cyclase with sensor [Acidobacteria bacterium]|nr:diguanylate cyclase with sensor [Acidobacteriota bacterium]
MIQAKQNDFARQNRRKPGAFDFLLVIVSLFALAATFFLSYADFDYRTKTIVFLVIAGLYLAFCFFEYFRSRKIEIEDRADEILSESEADTEIQNRLLALEEANRFFGASLKPADMLRLVSSRINEIVPFDACLFFAADDNKEFLKIEFAYGANARDFTNLEINAEKGAAGKTFLSGKAFTDEGLINDKTIYAKDFIKDFQTSISAPLLRRGEITGVLQLFSSKSKAYDKKSLELIEAVGERVAPLFAGSIALERSLSNALTDSLTALPNERAFYLVLETQIAESTRFQLERPLSVLSVDISEFSEFNQRFGHATGDRFLTDTGQKIKNQLRQMDFLARSAGDEFLVVLPTANEKITEEIVERIKRAFLTKPFEIDENEKVFIKLNFGAATFGRDGETAPQLLRTAILRKQQSKSDEQSNNILWFPKEYPN